MTPQQHEWITKWMRGQENEWIDDTTVTMRGKMSG